MKNNANHAAEAKTTDKDLRFLSSCENEDLRVLCDILTHDRLGNIRITEQLTSTDEYNRNYPEDMLFLVPQDCQRAYEIDRWKSSANYRTLFRENMEKGSVLQK